MSKKRAKELQARLDEVFKKDKSHTERLSNA